jgi:hypothetical protein
MEEAPLIVKKSAVGDKCASCNQNIVNSSNIDGFNSAKYKSGKYGKTYSGNMYLKNIPSIKDQFGSSLTDRIITSPSKKISFPEISVLKTQETATESSSVLKNVIRLRSSQIMNVENDYSDPKTTSLDSLNEKNVKIVLAKSNLRWNDKKNNK